MSLFLLLLASTLSYGQAIKPSENTDQYARKSGNERSGEAVFYRDNDATDGVDIGQMTLRSSLKTQVLYESEEQGNRTRSRTYNQTTLTAILQSDWSQHSLRLSGTGVNEKNISGTLSQAPSANLNADLELNINNSLTANLHGGYNFAKENHHAPNAISDASSQAVINTFTTSLALVKENGLLNGSVTAGVRRILNGDAILPANVIISGAPRDLWGAELMLRLQYEKNTALTPFIEGEIGRTKYDQTIDGSGLRRSYSNYQLRLGGSVDYSEKLNGDFSVGYATRHFDDKGLSNIYNLIWDSRINWSPRRGLLATLDLSTTIEPSTSAGISGSVLYALNTALSRKISHNLEAKLGVDLNVRDFKGGINRPDEISYGGNIALDWAITHHLSLNANAGYTRTSLSGAIPDRNNMRVGIGLTLKN